MVKRSSWLALLGIAVLGAVAAALALLLVRTTLDHAQAIRGVALGALPPDTPLRRSGSPYGVNVHLHQDLPNLARSLDLVQQGGYLWVRQRFPWAEIEPERSIYRWETYDRIVDEVTRRGLKLIAVLDTSPAWARSSRLDTSPPDNMEDYGNFVATFVERYRGRIGHIQVWDEPNVAPHWGEWWVSPDEYVRMLKIAYARAKAANPEVVILAGGLAPTVADDQWNLNDVTFLRRIYARGARGHFDILAAKPYGFWSGPDDRRVDPSVLNFSRLVLLREVMLANNDGARPIWAVEMGWNALPAGWTGKPSPWGNDTDQVQARRTLDALRRAQAEWPWLDMLVINGLRFPTAAPDDPLRGFALVDDAFAPRLIYDQMRALAGQLLVAGVGRYDASTQAASYSLGWTLLPAQGGQLTAYRSERTGSAVTLRFNGTGVAVYAWHGRGAGRLRVWLDGELLSRLPRSGPETGFVELGRQQDQGMVGVVLATGLPDGEHTVRLELAPGLNGSSVTIGGYDVIRSVSFLRLYGWLVLLALGVLACLAGVALLMPRLPWAEWDSLVDRLPVPVLLTALGVAVVVFYLGPLPLAVLAALTFAVLALSRLDLALLITALTFPFYLYPRRVGGQAFALAEVLTLLCFAAWVAHSLGTRPWGRLATLRLPVLFFLGAALLSLGASIDVHLSLRELRTVVIEPVLFYFMATATFDRSGRSLPRSALLWALVLGGTAAAVQALGQYFLTSHVITAEGVRRAVGPYGSPNNLGLLLERVLPLSLALALRNAGYKMQERTPHIPYLPTLCSLLVALALFLTYSRGAWLAALVGVLVFAALRGRRQVVMVLVGVGLLALFLLPLLRVERVASLLKLQGESTTTIRLDLWQSALEMIGDYPLRGVGLDGFLELYRGIYIRPTALREPSLSHPHNLVLEWWLFLGVLGTVALVWLLIGFFRRAWRAQQHMQGRRAMLIQGAMAAMSAAIAHGLVDRFYFGAPDLAFVFFSLLVISEMGN